MPIDFHATENRLSYASRQVDTTWHTMMTSLVNPRGKTVYDIGCGGGLYSRAWLDLGAAQVTGLDFSAAMIHEAQQHELANLSFQVGDATNTALPERSADIVFARALIHHLPDVSAFTHEAKRLLKPNGMVLIQGRSHDDVRQPSSAQHIRGILFECFPRLLELETARRHSVQEIVQALETTGFTEVGSHTFWETRRVYDSIDALADDLRARTGRSILHELSDDELEVFITTVSKQLGPSQQVIEQDHWTVWQGVTCM